MLSTYCNHVGGHVSNTTSPVRRGLVKNIVDSEAAVVLGKRIQVFLQENIRRRNIGEDQVNLSPVTSRTSSDNSANDLEHRSDTGTTSNHTEVSYHVGGVNEGSLGPLDLDCLTDIERSQVLGDVSGRVGLDQQINEAGLVVARYRGVGPNNLLVAAIRLRADSANGNVLANGKTKDGCRCREFESVATPVNRETRSC